LCADVAIQSGIKVTTASTTEEAISILENSAVDILMTDLKLPKSSGLDLLQRVHDQHREVAVSGAGKEMVARSIHYSGPRKNQPFAPVDGSSLVPALAVYAPVVVMGGAERETSLKALIAAGVADYVTRSDGSMNNALNLLEDRLARRQRIAECVPAKAAEEWSRDFAEILHHELNAGILGNAELLLAESPAKKMESSLTAAWNVSKP
jgi:DNA-binding NarL/FixJ family response regulator